jgi:phosphate transport system substrate-binding protein
MGPARVYLFLALLALWAAPAPADTLVLGGMGTGTLLLERLAEDFQKKHPGDKVSVPTPSMGSGGALRALQAGQIDLAVSGRPLTPEEQPALPAALEYARTPVGFATSSQTNRAGNLSLQTLVNIYSLKQTTWPDGRPIRLVLRPGIESDYRVQAGLAPEMAAALAESLRHPGMVVAKTDQEAVAHIEKTPFSLGITSLAMARLAGADVRFLALEHNSPSLDRLKSGGYPLSKSFYLVTQPKPSPVTRRFLAYLQSGAARTRLVELGTLPSVPARP